MCSSTNEWLYALVCHMYVFTAVYQAPGTSLPAPHKHQTPDTDTQTHINITRRTHHTPHTTPHTTPHHTNPRTTYHRTPHTTHHTQHTTYIQRTTNTKQTKHTKHTKHMDDVLELNSVWRGFVALRVILLTRLLANPNVYIYLQCSSLAKLSYLLHNTLLMPNIHTPPRTLHHTFTHTHEHTHAHAFPSRFVSL